MADHAAARQYLTFNLGKEVYAFHVGTVHEVLEMSTVTRLPQMPDYMVGLLNNRGQMLPVVDLRSRFGLEEHEDTIDTAVIVAEIGSSGNAALLGCRTDSVDGVVDLPPDHIEPPPRIGGQVETELIHGIGTLNGEFVIILDIERIFSAKEIAVAFTNH
jgi:purine-binding chemotaxis protein CheW